MKNITKLFTDIESTTSTKKKEQLITDFLFEHEDHHETYMKIIANEILPRPAKFNIGKATMIKAIASKTGYSEKEIKEMLKTSEFKNVSNVAKYCFENKQSTSFFDFGDLTVLPSVKSTISVLERLGNERKTSNQISIITDAFSSYSPDTIRYISHIILQDIPLKYNDPTIIKAIAQYKGCSNEEIERTFHFSTSMVKTLLDHENIKFNIGKAVPPMLAQLSKPEDIKVGKIMDLKLDGIRAKSHINHEINIYSRNLHSISESYPDIINRLEEFKELNPNFPEIVLDGEIISGNKFTDGNTRTRRKYDIDEYVEKFPAIYHVFDIIYCGKPLYDTPLKERRELLATLNFPEDIELVEPIYIESLEHFNEYYEKALENGLEGVMVKDPESTYRFGKKTKDWVKMKPSDTADLIVYGGKYGSNKNAGKYSSLKVRTGDGYEIGKVGSGLKDKYVDIVTEKINNGEEFMIEVSFEAVEEGKSTSSGYALRFPRFKKIRTDKPFSQATTLQELLEMKIA